MLYGHTHHRVDVGRVGVGCCSSKEHHKQCQFMIYAYKKGNVHSTQHPLHSMALPPPFLKAVMLLPFYKTRAAYSQRSNAQQLHAAQHNIARTQQCR
jgi:hypothetical protein